MIYNIKIRKKRYDIKKKDITAHTINTYNNKPSIYRKFAKYVLN